jgi:hypothetical protein
MVEGRARQGGWRGLWRRLGGDGEGDSLAGLYSQKARVPGKGVGVRPLDVMAVHVARIRGVGR